MIASELHKMYQAWLQGNENYIRDWANFVEWAARWNNTSSEKILQEVEKHRWFRKGD